MRLKEKYRPLFLVSYMFVIGMPAMMVLVAVKVIIDGGSFFEILKPVLFMSIMVIVCSYVFCEIRYYFHSRFWASVLFGIVNSQIFIASLLLESLIVDGEAKELRLNFYTMASLMLGFGLAVLYAGLVRK